MKFMGDVMSKSQDVSVTELYYAKRQISSENEALDGEPERTLISHAHVLVSGITEMKS